MTVTLDISLWLQAKRITDKVIDSINFGIELISQSVKEKTPTDTMQLINSNRISPVVNDQYKYWVKISNDTSYAKYVEYWVRWRSYNYHKWPPRSPSTRYYSWVGAKMFARTAIELENEIAEYISSQVASWIK